MLRNPFCVRTLRASKRASGWGLVVLSGCAVEQQDRRRVAASLFGIGALALNETKGSSDEIHV